MTHYSNGSDFKDRQIVYAKDLTPEHFAKAKQGDWFQGVGDVSTMAQAEFIQKFGNKLLDIQIERDRYLEFIIDWKDVLLSNMTEEGFMRSLKGDENERT
ncbi:MAG: hypothetical protein KAS32_10555 [Candidatus Peribacteraceae bacterium]|nr:hypothetical protein [Candidatus Peribacteraceae bacterium]